MFSTLSLKSRTHLPFVFLLAALIIPTTSEAETIVDAAVYANNRTYLFKGIGYFRLKGNTVEPGYPKLMGQWKGLPDTFLAGIDAALFTPNNKKIYMFKGSQYVRITGSVVDKNYPKSIAKAWKGLPKSFYAGLDAAIYRAGHTYFFKGNQYVRFTGTKMDKGYPRKLPGGWGLPSGFSSNIDAALNRPKPAKNYFFSGDRYVRLSDTKLDANYPASVENWKGLLGSKSSSNSGSKDKNSPSTEAEPKPKQSAKSHRLQLHVVPLADDDGVTKGTNITPTQFAERINTVNLMYRGTGIQFDFDPATDWHPQNNTQANSDATIWEFGNELAARIPGKIVTILRFGNAGINPQTGLPQPTGNGNAYPPPNPALKPPHVNDAVQNYIALPNDLGMLNQSDGFVPHEFGHYLGLYHTFPGWTDRCGPIFTDSSCNPWPPKDLTTADVTTSVLDYFADENNGVGLKSFDGDGLADTPPDPTPIPHLVFGVDICSQPRISLNGTDTTGAERTVEFNPMVTNVMSYFGCSTPDRSSRELWTRQQINRMHATLQGTVRNHLIKRPCPPDFVAVAADAFQNCFNYWVNRGFWPTTLSIDGTGKQLVAGSFQKGPERPVRSRLTSTQYQTAVDTLAKQGFRPEQVSVSQSETGPKFTSIWAPIDGEFEARHNLTSAEFSQIWKDKRAQGFVHIDMSAYQTTNGLRFHSVWVRKPSRTYASFYDMTKASYQKQFDEFWAKGMRPTRFVAYPSKGNIRYAVIWQKVPGSWAHNFDMSLQGFQQRYNALAKKGMRLHQVQLYGGGKKVSAIWTKP
ncbi:MAG: hemopexin repeat-containing protein [Hyphomicrobiales bacterium]